MGTHCINCGKGIRGNLDTSRDIICDSCVAYRCAKAPTKPLIKRNYKIGKLARENR